MAEVDAPGIVKKTWPEIVLLRLRLWSLLALPITGYLWGRISKWLFRSIMDSLMGPLLSHLVTMGFMIAVLNDMLLEGRVRDPKETMVFIVLGYLFVLGVLAGLVVS